MRLWSIHPRHLDRQALVAAWREGLLARAVLNGRTRGYRNHPQLVRFRACADPVATIDAWLSEIAVEAAARGYRFDRSKIRFCPCVSPVIEVTDGQLAREWAHLMRKLSVRDPVRHAAQLRIPVEASPVFRVVPGPVAPWERA